MQEIKKREANRTTGDERKTRLGKLSERTMEAIDRPHQHPNRTSTKSTQNPGRFSYRSSGGWIHCDTRILLVTLHRHHIIPAPAAVLSPAEVQVLSHLLQAPRPDVDDLASSLIITSRHLPLNRLQRPCRNLPKPQLDASTQHAPPALPQLPILRRGEGETAAVESTPPPRTRQLLVWSPINR